MKRQAVIFAVIICSHLNVGFSQFSQDWAMDQLFSYAPNAYSIVNGFKNNGPSISYNGNSTSNSMRHMELCDLKTVSSFLNSIATNVHETTHAYDSQVPYMWAKKGVSISNLALTEGFYINEEKVFCIEYPTTKLFPSNKLDPVIPESLRTFRYNTYIIAPPNQSTQSSGVIGLLEEFNAYYQGSKVIFDLYPMYEQEYGTSSFWSWSSDFVSNADSFYEFDFFIKEYLLFASQYKPELYLELKNHPTFSQVYQTIRKEYATLILLYEKKYEELKIKNTHWTTPKHSDIFTTLDQQIKSNRYQKINLDFLAVSD